MFYLHWLLISIINILIIYLVQLQIQCMSKLTLILNTDKRNIEYTHTHTHSHIHNIFSVSYWRWKWREHLEIKMMWRREVVKANIATVYLIMLRANRNLNFDQNSNMAKQKCAENVGIFKIPCICIFWVFKVKIKGRWKILKRADIK